MLYHAALPHVGNFQSWYIEINDNWGAEGPARRAGAYWAGQVPTPGAAWQGTRQRLPGRAYWVGQVSTPGAAWQGTRQRLSGRSGVCGGRSGYSLVTD